MTSPRPIKIANDNLPARHTGRANLSGVESLSPSFAAFEQPSPKAAPAIPAMLSKKVQDAPQTVTKSLMLTLSLWAAALLFALTLFTLGANTPLKALSSLALLWTGLWGSYIAADHGRWRLSEICVVTALAGLLGAVMTAANYFGLGFTFSDGLILMSIVPLVIGAVLKSRICILTAIAASLSWAALTFTASATLSGTAMLIPLILAAQIYVATRLKSVFAISFGVITAYYCLLSIALGFYTADELPLTFAAAALFSIGAAHHRSGKALEDKDTPGSAVHIYAGWVAAMVGAIGFQYLWLTPDALKGGSASLSVTGLTLWKTTIMASLGVIFSSAIIRYKHSQITFAGIFLLTISSAIIPMMLWFPAWPRAFFAALPGAVPLITAGVIMGAAITAMSVGMVLNGARRHSKLMMGLGLCGLLAQGYLLLNPSLMTLDNSIIFTGSFLAALAIGGVIAGSSLAHQAPAPKLKHG